MKKPKLLIVLLLAFNSAFSQSENCLKCYEAVENTYKNNLAKIVKSTTIENVYIDFKKFFYSDEFEKYVSENSSAPFKIPTPIGFLSFGSNKSTVDWQRRKTIIQKDELVVDRQFLFDLYILNPQLEMAESFNDALEKCTSGPCKEDELGKTTRVEIKGVTENDVALRCIYKSGDNSSKPPKIASFYYDRNIFKLTDEKKFIGKPLDLNGTDFQLVRNKSIPWETSFFRITFIGGSNPAMVTIPGKLITAKLDYKYKTGQMLPNCQTVTEQEFTNEGCHNSSVFPCPLKCNSGGISFKCNAEKAGDWWAVHMIRELPAQAGYKYQNVSITPTNWFNDQDRLNFHKTYVEYFDEGGRLTSIPIGTSVNVHTIVWTKPIRYTISYQRCSYYEEVKDVSKQTVQFDNKDIAYIKVGLKSEDLVLTALLNSKIHIVYVDKPEKNDSDVNKHFIIELLPQEAEIKTYKVTIRR